MRFCKKDWILFLKLVMIAIRASKQAKNSGLEAGGWDSSQEAGLGLGSGS